MKTNTLKITFPIITLVSVLALGLLPACKPKDTAAEKKAEESAPAAAAPTAPTPPAAPATPVPAPVPETAPAAAAATPAAATATAGVIRYDAQPVGSKARIEGTSSIHDWHMESAVVGGFMEVDAKFPESALTDPAAAKPNIQASIPVRSLKSGTKRMDEVMQEKMEEPKFKKIEYKLTELKPKSAAGATGALQFESEGELTIHGVTKTLNMPVTIEKQDGKLKVAGSTSLKMSDYKVEAPKLSLLGLGSITTGDDIKVIIEWMAAPKVQ